MRFVVKVKPGVKIARIKVQDKSLFTIYVTEPAREGKANRAIIKALASYFQVASSRVIIVSGVGAREKIIEIN